jgi:hypothetical protein
MRLIRKSTCLVMFYQFFLFAFVYSCKIKSNWRLNEDEYIAEAYVGHNWKETSI